MSVCFDGVAARPALAGAGGHVLLHRAHCDDGAQRAAGRGIARSVGFFDGIRSVAGGDCAGGDDLLLAAIGAV